jgi:hypothetical protein
VGREDFEKVFLAKAFTAAAWVKLAGTKVKYDTQHGPTSSILRVSRTSCTIKRLKADEHFRKMFDEYHRLDDAIYPSRKK